MWGNITMDPFVFSLQMCEVRSFQSHINYISSLVMEYYSVFMSVQFGEIVSHHNIGEGRCIFIHSLLLHHKITVLPKTIPCYSAYCKPQTTLNSFHWNCSLLKKHSLCKTVHGELVTALLFKFIFAKMCSKYQFYL